MSFLPKLIYRMSVSVNRFFLGGGALFCLELDNTIMKFPLKSKGPRITEKQF